MPTGIQQRLRSFADEADSQFERLVPPVGREDSKLSAALRYALLAPGKRLRPYLVVRCCELVGGARELAWPVAAAVECVHAFSLVHDDLPAMDNDDLRRGRPTTHKQFDEATAILAGDALVVLAFELIAGHVSNATIASRLVQELARATGWAGMIGGQAADLDGEKSPPSIELTHAIHDRKTAILFCAAGRLGAIVGGGTETQIEAVGNYGRHFGLSFQIADDLLDVTSTAEELGKTVGKDARAGKQTYPAGVGVQASRVEAAAARDRAIEALSSFGDTAEDLCELARYVVARVF
jgi:farnesyl diphosphate synthase